VGSYGLLQINTTKKGNDKMAACIRLKKMGTKKRPHFQIIVCDQKRGRNTRAIEEIGFYDPSKNPAYIKIDKERVSYWVGVGAQMSETVKSIVKKI
jgi:small subunit ribosomal protein S16